MPAPAIEAAFLAACRAEIAALKPGNVHRFAPGHGMEAATFEASALASAPSLAAPGAPVGRRVLESVEASFAAVGVNTNLGILLLSAPLALAAERGGYGQGAAALRRATQAVLAGLDAADASHVFQAIARASPGGLGRHEGADVRRPPTISLVEAMRLAAGHDLVARQYADGYADIFETGLPALGGAGADSPLLSDPAFGPAGTAYLAFAARHPDSHILRKYGAGVAETVRGDLADLAKHLISEKEAATRFERALALDASLKARGLNPGTSADLTVASLFAKSLAEGGPR
ncbi:triphosphoribosyl-dephospho-CoA synthase [Aurantimonas sp. Leaf443]|uniref:triphosphoribosyl-dephospho-CoA synthase n=1 Tax=Aurantimonas sp. Leaf443 TaxID=1736378 RepID=UPI0006F582A6|nr:triphosphoribosyl-dephospho-CoA synthase [Aurantimonas sp. Leaf443]KQT85226.1 triphosphoribosyl-dephospho-CoA synthase [Aurantimonas sp. Leaf443]